MPLSQFESKPVYQLLSDSPHFKQFVLTSLEECTGVVYTYDELVETYLADPTANGEIHSLDINNLPEVIVDRYSNRGVIVWFVRDWLTHIVSITQTGQIVECPLNVVNSFTRSGIKPHIKSAGVKFERGVFSRYTARNKADHSDSTILYELKRSMTTVVSKLVRQKYGFDMQFIHCRDADKFRKIAQFAQSNGWSVSDIINERQYLFTSNECDVGSKVYVDTVAKFAKWFEDATTANLSISQD
jgi:hypothetical protein